MFDVLDWKCNLTECWRVERDSLIRKRKGRNTDSICSGGAVRTILPTQWKVTAGYV